MDGLHRALGVGPTVFFDGRQCTVHARDLGFDALAEAEIIKRRGNPMDQVVAAAAQLPRDSEGNVDERALVAIANAASTAARLNRNATYGDHHEFLTSPAGEALLFWHCLKHNFDVSWSVDRVRWVLMESFRRAIAANDTETYSAWLKWKQDVRASVDMASGADVLGNLTGLHLPTKAEAVPSPAGDASSESSGKTTEPTPETPPA